MSVRPVFLLSLPRSGSTLVQRLLASHPEVATAAEPWVMLPHLYARRERGIAAEYTQPIAARAITEAAPVPVPPPIPAVMNTMWQPTR